MKKPIAIPNDCRDIRVKFSPQFSALCTIGVSPFSGILDITFEADKSLLEFEAFEDYLIEISTKNFTVESLCRHIFNLLIKELDPISLRVTVNATTIKHAPAVAELVCDDVHTF